MKKILLLLTILFSLNSFSQNNNYNNYLKKFLEDYPMYNNIDNLYFELVSMDVFGKNQVFNVYKKHYVGNEKKIVQFKNYDNQIISGEVQFMLFPIIFSTYTPYNTDPPTAGPSVDRDIKCIILSKIGTKIISLSQVKIN
ncbi:hypothetical protein [Myroides odoratus]|uniref:Uncharacterized protein n=2 Tax=Myroides odoratus TaxID=256 RepID=A0A9Q7E7U3_MYROD|nr:hypothetical protein [Myroides odoratus]EHQ41532.1 hypothetical protein Myrod_0696 [Myroides odoratus DSM 2801]QQT98952.1 hypothetical protein I6I88_12090 [Myroides odoratus]WQD58861.1 hypothetical protein U0010_06885 [Myroides odoratus]STZ28795.1 Uncharacterised protein [Myroides odoratus]